MFHPSLLGFLAVSLDSLVPSPTLPTLRHLHQRIVAAAQAEAVVEDTLAPVPVPVLAALARVLAADANHPSL